MNNEDKLEEMEAELKALYEAMSAEEKAKILAWDIFEDLAEEE